MKKISKNNRLDRQVAMALFGVGFVAPMLVITSAEAVNYGGAGVVPIITQAEHEAQNGTKWIRSSKGYKYINEDNCFVIYDKKGMKHLFKIAESTGYTTDSRLTLWCYDDSFGYDLFCEYNSERDKIYVMSDLASKVRDIESKLVGVEVRKYTAAPGDDTRIYNEIVWLPSKTELQRWANKDFQRASFVGKSSWLRTTAPSKYKSLYKHAIVRSVDGVIDDVVGFDYKWCVRPALQMMNQQYCNFTSGAALSTDKFTDNSIDSGTTYYYSVNKYINKPGMDLSKAIKLDGKYITLSVSMENVAADMSVAFSASDSTVTETTLTDMAAAGHVQYLTAGTELSGAAGYYKEDISNLTGDAYRINVFGTDLSGTTYNTTEFGSTALYGVKYADGAIHITLGSMNKDLNLELDGGATVDLDGLCRYSSIVLTNGATGVLNLGTYGYGGELSNKGTLTLKGNGGTFAPKLKSYSTGSCAYVVDGDIVFAPNKGELYATTITINQGASLRNSGVIHGKVINNGTLTARVNIGSRLSNNGTCNLAYMHDGAIGVPIEGNGAINVVENETVGESTITGQTINVNEDKKLTVTSSTCLDATDDLVLNGILDISSVDGTNNITLGNLSTGSKNLLIFTADLEADKCDTLTLDTIAAGTYLNLDGINIINEDSVHEGEKLQVVNASQEQLKNLTFGTTTTATSGGVMYDFKQDTTDLGAIVATKQQKNYTLPQVVQGTDAYAGVIETYSLTADTILTEDLGTLQNYGGSTDRELTIVGNGYTLDGAKHEGITVGTGGVLNLMDIADMTNFQYVGLTKRIALTTSGTVNIIDSRITGDVLVNKGGKLNAAADAIKGEIENNGTLTLSSGVLVSAITYSKTQQLNADANLIITGNVEAGTKNIEQRNMTIQEGATFTMDVGKGGIYESGVRITDSLKNEGTFTFSGRGNLSRIYNGIEGSGVFVLDGANVAFVYGSKDPVVENSVVLTRSTDKLYIAPQYLQGTVDNAGSVYLQGTSSSGKYYTLPDGSTISGAGKIFISDGNVAARVQDLAVTGGIVNNNTLTLTGSGSLNGDITVEDGAGSKLIVAGTVDAGEKSITQKYLTVDSTGNLTVNVNNLFLANDIDNSGTLTLTGEGTLEHNLNGATGKFVVDGTIIVKGSIYNETTINNGKTLTIDTGDASGTLGKIGGDGTLVLDGDMTGAIGDLTSAGGIVVNNKLTLTDSGTLATRVSGDGSLEFTAAVSANIDYLGVTGGITNNSILTLTDTGSVSSVIKGSGSLINSGTLSANADNIAQAMVNNNIYNVCGGTVAKDISGTGSMNVQGNTVFEAAVTGQSITVAEGTTLTAKVANVLDATDDLTLNGTLDISGTDCTTVVNLKNFASAATSNLIFSADISGNDTAKSDSLNLQTITENSVLNIDGINLVSYDLENTTETIRLITAATDQLVNLTINPTTVALSNGYSYTFKQNENDRGTLTATREGGPEPAPEPGEPEEEEIEVTLPDVVQNINGRGEVDSYSLIGDYSLDEDLGTLTRVEAETARTLTVFGNNHKLDGQANAGIVVNEGDTLNLMDISSMTNFEGNIVTTSGIVGVENSTLDGNVEVKDSGEIALIGNSVLQGKLAIKDYGFALISDESQVKGEITVSEGGILYTTAGGFSGGIANEGGLALSGNGTMQSNITGDGYVTIYGEVTTGGHSIKQESMYIVSDGKLTAAYADISSIGIISDYGTLILTDAATLTKTISGTGKLELQENVSSDVNYLAITGGITTDKVLTLTGTGTLASEVSGDGSLAVAGTVTTTVDNLGTVTDVTGNLIITDSGTLAKTISGEGKLTLQDAVTVAVGSLQVAETVNNDQLILTGTGTLQSKITGAGALVVAEEVTAAGEKLAYTGATTNAGTLILSSGSWSSVSNISGSGTLQISSGAALTADADNVGNAIVNNGTYNVSSGREGSTVAYTVSGSGRMNIEGSINLGAAVTGQSITVAEGATLVATGYLDSTDNLTLNGTLDFGSDTCDTQLIIGTLSATNTSELNFHGDISGEGAKSDSITVTSIASGTVLNIDGINLTTSDTEATENLEVIKCDTASELAKLTINSTSTVVSSGDRYTFVQDTSADAKRGTLIATKETTKTYTLPEIIQNTAGNLDVDTYSLVDNYTCPADLGTLGRDAGKDSRELTIEGNGYLLDGDGKAGVTVNAGDTLNLKDIYSMENFAGDVLTVAGFVNLENTKIDGSVTIKGKGELDVYGGSELTGTINLEGEGIIFVEDTSRVSGNLNVGENASLMLYSDNFTSDLANNGNVIIYGDGTLQGNISGTGTTTIFGKAVLEETSITQDKLAIGSHGSLTTPLENLNIAKEIDNDGAFILTSGGTLNTDITGDGTTYFNKGDFRFMGDKIENAVVIASGATLDPAADTFYNTVDNSGTLVLEGGALSQQITNNSGSTLSVTNPVALTIGGSIAFASGSTLDVGTELGEAVLIGISDASMLNIASGSILDLAGDNIVNGGTYTILQGTDVKNIKNLWSENDINFDSRITHTRWVSGDDTMALQVNFTTDAELNVLGLAGVQQGMISINNQTADAVAEHLRSALKDKQDNDAYDIEIWATYIYNKDTVQGLTTGGYDSNYKAQYNGVTVGMDLETSRKAITGVALTYATGDTNGSGADAQIRNESKYYGISFYNRVTNKHSAIITDMSFTHGKNELDVIQFNGSEADAKVNSFSAGVRWEKDIQLKGSKIVPFAGVRYLFLQNRDFTNSKNLNYTTDNQNLIIPKVGLTWSGEYKMSKSQWTAKPHAEIGYLWNLGNKKADVVTNVNGYPLDSSFYVTDKNSYYLKTGIEFTKNNLTCGFDYSYAKGDAIRNNRWNVNLSYSF